MSDLDEDELIATRKLYGLDNIKTERKQNGNSNNK